MAMGLLQNLLLQPSVDAAAAEVLNPWGIPAVSLLLLFCTATDRQIQANLGIKKAVVAGGIVVPILLLLVGLGWLEGNTGKVAEGLGGVGLANHSTNETAQVLVGCLIWVAGLDASRGWKRWLLVGLLGGALVLTGSRTGVVLGSLVALGVLFQSSGTRRVAGTGLVLLSLVVALFVAARRTAIEVEGTAESPTDIRALPGSGRPAIWASYSMAFVERVEEQPWRLWLGTGTLGLLDLYDRTPLFEFDLSLADVSFYPLHSTLLEVCFAYGLVGVVAVGSLTYGLFARARRASPRIISTMAILALMLLAAVDMVTYVPIVPYLLGVAGGGSGQPGAPDRPHA